MINIFYSFLHLLVWLLFSFISFGLIKSSKFKVNMINLPIIIMFITMLLLLTKFSLMGGIFSKIYFALGFFVACLETIAINIQVEGIEKINVKFHEKILQFFLVLFFIPQHLLLIACWFLCSKYGLNEKFKS